MPFREMMEVISCPAVVATPESEQRIQNALEIAIGVAPAVQSEQSKDSLPETWEYFCDTTFYDLWRVRRKTERSFEEGFNLRGRDEAKALTELLNENKVP